MSIRTKLLSSFLFITLLILIMLVTQQLFTIKEKDLLQQIVVEHEISAQLSALSTAAQKIRRYEKEYFIYVQNPNKREKYAGEFSDASDEIQQHLNQLKTIYTNSGKQQSLETLKEWEDAASFYTGGFNQLTRRVLSGEITSVLGANQAIQEYKNRFRVLLSGTSESIKNQYQLATQKAKRITEYQETSSLIFIAISTLSLIIALVMSFRVPAGIVNPLRQLTEVANGLSKGKVKDSGDIGGSIEIEELAKSIKRMQAATMGLLKRVRESKA